ncbi:MAG TPA: fluoride efflux transporter CrcB [Rhodospirillales bacterium]|nr:fluoride efflux transporter CrcB [Rhodospirillales bacterium]
MEIYLWVGFGSALGGIARYAVSGLVAGWIGETFPFGTLTVNVLGSFGIGLFAAVTAPDGRLLVDPAVRQFAMVGLFGGFTTFSSFSLQTLALIQDGEWPAAVANVLASVTACLIGVWLGTMAGLYWNRLPGG